jgi:hypothetical protein
MRLLRLRGNVRKRWAQASTNSSAIYLVQLAGKSDRQADADEFERLAQKANGNSRGRKFNRDVIHDRR